MVLLSTLRMNDLLLGPLNILLQMHKSVENCLRSWRAPRNVHVHRDDLINSCNGRVVIIEAAGRSARAECDDPLGLCHLLIHSQQNRGEFVVDGSYHPKKIRLSGCESRKGCSKPVSVVMRAVNGHELHATARGYEGV